ncbi:MAG: hypothetical protein QG564_359 [Campylobacterota bacterium]|nr:hypothetical protein [Campylobacterota bacterium]
MTSFRTFFSLNAILFYTFDHQILIVRAAVYLPKKEKLYISDLIQDAAVPYPAYYTLSASMHQNEMLRSALASLHGFDFSFYEKAKNYEDIFALLHSGGFPIYKEKYIVGYFGNKMMYLESNGWKAMPATQELFMPENWLVC